MKTHLRNQRRLLAWSLSGLGVWMSAGCSSLSPSLQQEPDHVFSTTTPQMLEQSAGHPPLPARARYPEEQPTAAAGTRSSADGVVRLGPKRNASASPGSVSLPGSASLTEVSHIAVSDIAAAQATHPQSSAGRRPESQSEFQLVAFRPDECEVDPLFQGSQFHPADPRLECPPGAAPLHRMETIAASPLADVYPDEYIYDGGDRDLSAAMHSNRSGLDTEDTVAAFADHTGERRVTPSNRVAVYSPRFGSIRTVSGLVADTKVDKAVGAKDSIAVGNLKTGNAAQENVHGTILYGLETRNRVDGMKGATPPMQTRRTEIAGQNRKVDEGHEGRNYSGPETFNRNDGIVIAEQMRNAITWSRNEFPVITAVTTNASEISAKFKVQQTIGVKDERETRGNVHIVKLADREIAQSGETITFTIQFRNTGDFDVYEVTIVDNLTPRLQYTGGSAVIDSRHPGEVSVEPNGEGSEILTFRLDKPLKGHDSGTITFEATVR